MQAAEHYASGTVLNQWTGKEKYTTFWYAEHVPTVKSMMAICKVMGITPGTWVDESITLYLEHQILQDGEKEGK